MSNFGKGLDFARGILEKYGWKEGQGLGRNKNGIIEAMKPALKFDCGGIGYNGVSEQFTSRWWEQSYNEVAKSICVTKKKGGVKVKQRNREDLFKKKDSRPVSLFTSTDYNSFVKTSLLTEEGVMDLMKQNSNESATLEKGTGNVEPMGLTDEEIFQACSGRTVHKGARHGLRLSGKLARIERQEELLLRFQLSDKEGSRKCYSSHKGPGLPSVLEKGSSKKIHEVGDGDVSAFSDEKERKKKKKKKKKKVSPNTLLDCDLDLPVTREKKRLDSEHNETFSAIYTIPESTCSFIPLDCNVDPEKSLSKKKRKKGSRKYKGELQKHIDCQVSSEFPESQKKQKRKQDKDADGYKCMSWGKNQVRASKVHSVNRMRLQSVCPVISSEQHSPPLINSVKETIANFDPSTESLVNKCKKRKHKSKEI